MTFTLCHASGNMFAPRQKRVAIIHTAALRSDVFTLSEAVKDHAAIRAVPGFDSVISGELAVVWNSSKFEMVTFRHRLVMRGGRHGAARSSRKDHRRRGPGREVLWVLLRELATGGLVIVSTHHAIAKADTSHKWRRPLRRGGFRNTARVLINAQRRFPTADVVLTGDMNTVGRISFAAARLWQVLTPATFGRRRYDRIFRHGLKVSRVRRLKTAGDHRALLATVTLRPVKPTPAPEPIPVPEPTPETPTES